MNQPQVTKKELLRGLIAQLHDLREEKADLQRSLQGFIESYQQFSSRFSDAVEVTCKRDRDLDEKIDTLLNSISICMEAP